MILYTTTDVVLLYQLMKLQENIPKVGKLPYRIRSQIKNIRKYQKHVITQIYIK